MIQEAGFRAAYSLSDARTIRAYACGAFELLANLLPCRLVREHLPSSSNFLVCQFIITSGFVEGNRFDEDEDLTQVVLDVRGTISITPDTYSHAIPAMQ